MTREPAKLELYQALVEASTGDTSLYTADIGSGQAAFDDAQRKVDQIASAKEFNQGITWIVIAAQLVVHFDHELDFDNPLLKVVLSQIFLCQRNRRRQVVKGVGSPNSEIVKAAGNDNFVAFLRCAVTQRKAKVYHATDMVVIARIVATDLLLPPPQ